MVSIAFPERNVPAGKWVSPGVLVPPNNYDIVVTLGSSQWAAKAGLGTVAWGFEMSKDGGTTWEFLCSGTSVIGSLGKFGTMPSLYFKGPILPGTIVRIYVLPSINIRLSATGEIR